MTSDAECARRELEIEDGLRTRASEKQEGTLPSRTASKETPLLPQDEESKEKGDRDKNPREPEDGEPLYRPKKNFEEKPGNHGGAHHVPGGAWHSQGKSNCSAPKRVMEEKKSVVKVDNGNGG
ncbi:hypothetical protein NDU88_001288 [Pleurodeles waltl]|uniref:Uncharacterized protein n=1 Tax=Pleurodeles waltl TaxID=8319 RepID=A0AAV7V807_PLEWA|nr:hypothetical protein NDU88_001288 [Pleurodeles waltl]